MVLKVMGGSLKGREVKTPKTIATRPVTSLLRKSIFDSCQMFIEDAVVVDLFAGSGMIGIEALSRGAAYAIFVDKAPIAVRCIRENIDHLQLKERSLVIQGDAFEVYPKLKKEINILFLDPPYPIGVSGYLQLIEMIKEHRDMLATDAHIYLELPTSFAKEILEAAVKDFSLFKERKSSTTTLYHFYA